MYIKCWCKLLSYFTGNFKVYKKFKLLNLAHKLIVTYKCLKVANLSKSLMTESNMLV